MRLFYINIRVIDLVLLALIGATIGSEAASSASFDCSRASTGVERTICADRNLSMLDERLSDAYSLAKVSSVNLQRLVQDQRAWLAARNKCSTASCIAEAINTRIGELGSEQQSPAQAGRPSERPSTAGLSVIPSASTGRERSVTAESQPYPPTDGPSQQAAAPAPVQNVTNVSTNVVVALKSDAADLRGMISLFKEMIAEQRTLARLDNSSDVAQQAISVLMQRMTELQVQFRETTTQLSTYVTSVKPNDPDLQITARRASELFPKIPYYIPGTSDTGEFWLEPVVSNVGELMFNLKFIDPSSKDRVRESVELSSAQLELVRNSMEKIVGWSKTAHENLIRKDFSRRAVCFPQQGCPEEGGKLDKSASTEIIFRVYEDGSTAGRIQRNKGRFESGYNISIESSLLLQAYLNHILLEGKKEFDAGSRDASQLRELFK